MNDEMMTPSAPGASAAASQRSEGQPQNFSGWATLKDGRRIPLTAEEAEAIWRLADEAKVRRAETMPDERAAINALQEAYTRLKELGWREAIYCPKDGSFFDSIEAGSTGIHNTRYDGQWPDGHWWIYADGDIFVSRPILFRPKQKHDEPRGLSASEQPCCEAVINNPVDPTPGERGE